jgi:hypothetical protein
MLACNLPGGKLDRAFFTGDEKRDPILQIARASTPRYTAHLRLQKDETRAIRARRDGCVRIILLFAGRQIVSHGLRAREFVWISVAKLAYHLPNEREIWKPTAASLTEKRKFPNATQKE